MHVTGTARQAWRVREATSTVAATFPGAVIADLQRAGHGVREIAISISRGASTVSRELRRNRDQTSALFWPHRWAWEDVGRAALVTLRD